MPKTDITLFLESDEYGCEEFKAENWREAMVHLRDLYADTEAAVEDDGIARKVGILISGEEKEEDGIDKDV